MTEHIVLAISRLTRQKGFDRLIAAFEPVARQHPDWRLHIFGTGVDRDQLLHAVVDRDLGDQVALLGSTQHLDEM